MKRYTPIALAAAALVAVGCKDNPVANPIDAPTVGGQVTLQQLMTGVLAQDRLSANVFAYAIEAGIWARDVYRIDASEPRFVQETLGGNPDPGSFAGGGAWANYYTAIRAGNSVILALPGIAATPGSGLVPAQVAATRRNPRVAATCRISLATPACSSIPTTWIRSAPRSIAC